MTTAQIVKYYTDLLILQYRDKPKARANVALGVDPFVMDQLPNQIQNAFNLDTAVGVQLDVLGKYAGISRNVRTFTTLISLDDFDFRNLIKMQITQNNSGSSLASIQNLIQIYFPLTLRVFDYQNMHMSYFFDSDAGSLDLAEVLVRQSLLPKPMGVQLGALIFLPNLINLFVFRTYDLPQPYGNGFNSYGTYNQTWTWLSYADAISL